MVSFQYILNVNHLIIIIISISNQVWVACICTVLFWLDSSAIKIEPQMKCFLTFCHIWFRNYFVKYHLAAIEWWLISIFRIVFYCIWVLTWFRLTHSVSHKWPQWHRILERLHHIFTDSKWAFKRFLLLSPSSYFFLWPYRDWNDSMKIEQNSFFPHKFPHSRRKWIGIFV